MPSRPINCTHVGTFSPVLFRFEGGDARSGFFVEECKSVPPEIKFYGDLKNARLVFYESLRALPSLLDLALAGNFTDIAESNVLAWFSFELWQSVRVVIYCGPQGIVITRTGDLYQKFLGDDLYEAYQHASNIYKEFYNTGF